MGWMIRDVGAKGDVFDVMYLSSLQSCHRDYELLAEEAWNLLYTWYVPFPTYPLSCSYPEYYHLRF